LVKTSLTSDRTVTWEEPELLPYWSSPAKKAVMVTVVAWLGAVKTTVARPEESVVLLVAERLPAVALQDMVFPGRGLPPAESCAVRVWVPPW